MAKMLKGKEEQTCSTVPLSNAALACHILISGMQYGSTIVCVNEYSLLKSLMCSPSHMSDNTYQGKVFNDFSLKTAANGERFFQLLVLWALMLIERFLDIPHRTAPVRKQPGRCHSTNTSPHSTFSTKGDEDSVIKRMFSCWAVRGNIQQVNISTFLH